MKSLPILIILAIAIFFLIQSGLLPFRPPNMDKIVETVKTKSDEVKDFLALKVREQGLDTKNEIITQHEKTRADLSSLILDNKIEIVKIHLSQRETEFNIKSVIQNYSMVIIGMIMLSVFGMSLLILVIAYLFLIKRGNK